jgi:hypothetical protein
MDQPTIYSETVREKVGAFGVWRSAFGVRCSAFGVRRPGDTARGGADETLKTGAADLQKEQYSRRAEFFALPISCPRKPQALLALLVTDY